MYLYEMLRGRKSIETKNMSVHKGQKSATVINDMAIKATLFCFITCLGLALFCKISPQETVLDFFSPLLIKILKSQQTKPC